MNYAIVYKYTPTDMFSGTVYPSEYRTYITKDNSDKERVMTIIHNSDEYELVSNTPVPEIIMHGDADKLLRIVNAIINELLQKENCIFSLVKQMSEFDDYNESWTFSFKVTAHGTTYVEEMNLKLTYQFRQFILSIMSDFGFTDVTFRNYDNTEFVVTVKGS